MKLLLQQTFSETKSKSVDITIASGIGWLVYKAIGNNKDAEHIVVPNKNSP